jgi:hypothetical protein
MVTTRRFDAAVSDGFCSATRSRSKARYLANKVMANCSLGSPSPRLHIQKQDSCETRCIVDAGRPSKLPARCIGVACCCNSCTEHIPSITPKRKKRRHRLLGGLRRSRRSNLKKHHERPIPVMPGHQRVSRIRAAATPPASLDDGIQNLPRMGEVGADGMMIEKFRRNASRSIESP